MRHTSLGRPPFSPLNILSDQSRCHVAATKVISHVAATKATSSDRKSNSARPKNRNAAKIGKKLMKKMKRQMIKQLSGAFNAPLRHLRGCLIKKLLKTIIWCFPSLVQGLRIIEVETILSHALNGRRWIPSFLLSSSTFGTLTVMRAITARSLSFASSCLCREVRSLIWHLPNAWDEEAIQLILFKKEA